MLPANTPPISLLYANETAFLFYGNVAVTLALGINPDVHLGMMLSGKNRERRVTLIAGENVAMGIWKDSKVNDAAVELPELSGAARRTKTNAEATGNNPFDQRNVDLGMISLIWINMLPCTFPFFAAILSQRLGILTAPRTGRVAQRMARFVTATLVRIHLMTNSASNCFS